jgi:hypothetical protein
MAPTTLLIVAKIMLAVFTGLGIWSLAMTVQTIRKKAEPDPKKLAAAKRSLLLCSWVVFAAIAGAINAVSSRQYYLLFASALLFSYVLPLIALYVKTNLAIKRQGRAA